jgi:AcrR family transcriptional regulator
MRRAGRPSASEVDALNRAIVAAALHEFLDRGFSGASIERIAKGAKVARMAIYRRYGDKKTLFETVLHAQIRKLEELATTIGNEAEDPLTELRLTARAYLEFMISPTAVNLQRILITEASHLPTLSMQVAPPLPPSLGERLDGLIESAQRADQLVPGPPSLFREALIRLVAEGPRWDILMRANVWTADDVDRHFDNMWPFFLKIAAS